jgi:hypothetical protein
MDECPASSPRVIVKTKWIRGYKDSLQTVNHPAIAN